MKYRFDDVEDIKVEGISLTKAQCVLVAHYFAQAMGYEARMSYLMNVLRSNFGNSTSSPILLKEFGEFLAEFHQHMVDKDYSAKHARGTE